MEASRVSRIGIMGGSFDPPHLGHEHLAFSAVDQLDLDSLLIFPARHSPFKEGHRATDAQRLRMTRIMAEAIVRRVADMPGDRRLRICDINVRDDELYRSGPSYSWETLDLLKKEFTKSRFYLIIGDDNLQSFSRWKKWRSILEDANLGVVPRESGFTAQFLPAELEEYGDSVHFIDCPVFPVSSTELRRMLATGEESGSPGSDSASAEKLINPDVYEFIRSDSIYILSK